jgi:hypothetical protein
MLGIMFWLALLGMARQGWATDNCFECVLGIWDDPALASNLGEIVPGQPKDVYIGIKFAGGFDRLVGIAFSVALPSGVHVTSVWPIVGDVIWTCDAIDAPADTSLDSHMVGGCAITWGSCRVGDQALLRVTLLATGDITNGLLRVKRQYPSSPPDVRTPAFVQCDDPQFTITRLTGGYYILNWNGDPTVRVDGTAWSTVKCLYR